LVAKKLVLRYSVLRRCMAQRGGREPTAASRRPTKEAALPSADQAAESARLQPKSERFRMERDILKSRSQSLLEFGDEIPLHRRSTLLGEDQSVGLWL
jgi:hypothetical protein